MHTSDADDQNVQVSLDELLVQWPTKPLRGRSVQFRVPTASEALAPERAVGGYQRPFGGPNLWASAPLTTEDAWLRLDWDRPVVAREIVLVFDDDPDIELNTLHHHRDPHLVMPSLVGTYRVEVQVAGSEEWTEVATVADNRRRRRSHPLPPEWARSTPPAWS